MSLSFSHLSRMKWKQVSVQRVMFRSFRKHFQFMEIKLVFNFTKAKTVSDRRVMTFFKRRVGINQDSRREESGFLDTETLMLFPYIFGSRLKLNAVNFETDFHGSRSSKPFLVLGMLTLSFLLVLVHNVVVPLILSLYSLSPIFTVLDTTCLMT